MKSTPFARTLGFCLALALTAWASATLGVRAAEQPPKSAPSKPRTPAKPAPSKTKPKAAPSGAKAAKPAPTAPAKNPNVISRNPYIGAIAIQASTGTVLAEDNADARGYPASMLKLMDLLLVLERIDARQLSLQDQVVVSAKAAKTGGSQVWLAEKEVFMVEDLLYALMIQSANDAAVALAEKVAGSTEAFVELMNRRARELGMTHTIFQSPHGLPPGAGQQPDVTTSRDFALLCRELVKRPEVFAYTSARERPFRPNGGDKMVVMRTHNHLLSQVSGCDGLKTGYFALAGFSIAATAQRNGERVIVVVLGSADRKVRDAKAAALLNQAFTRLGGTSTTQTPTPAPTAAATPARPVAVPPPLPTATPAPAPAATRR